MSAISPLIKTIKLAVKYFPAVMTAKKIISAYSSSDMQNNVCNDSESIQRNINSLNKRMDIEFERIKILNQNLKDTKSIVIFLLISNVVLFIISIAALIMAILLISR